MSDAGTVAAPTGSLADALGGVAGAIAKEIPGAIEEDKANRALIRKAAEGTVSAMDAAAQERAALKRPPVPPPEPPPQQQNTSPVEAWGSAAMGMAMLGSAFTKRPAINSLNAAAGVMNAYKARDSEEYKRNLEHWKLQSEYSLKMYEYQREAYKDALSDIDAKPNLAMAKLRVIASSFGDSQLKHLAEMGNAAGVVQTLRMNDIAYEKAKTEGRRAAEMGELQAQWFDAQKALKAAPNDPVANANYQAATKALHDFTVAQKGGYSPSEQKDVRANELRDAFTKEWQGKHPGEDMPPAVREQIDARVAAAESGRTAGAAGSRAAAVSDRVQAEVQKFMAANPAATPEQIEDARWQAQVRATQQLEGAAHAPKSERAIFITKFMDENPHASSDDIAQASATFQRLRSTESAFAGGVLGRNLQSLNTVAGHILDVKEYGEALKNGDIPRANQIANRFAIETGQPEVTNFRAGRDIMAGEVVRLLTTTGGTEADRRKMEENLADKFSPEQMHGAIGVFTEMIRDRLTAMEQGYARNDPARRREFETNMLTDKAKKVFGVIGRVPPPSGAAPHAPGAAPGSPPTITNKAEYDALPSGAEYTGPDGKPYRKQ